MKHFNKLRISLLYSILLISSILATETVMKKTVDTTDNKCGDPCQECQRAVYQMKFQGSADCSGVCRDTCYKVREEWGTAFNPFEPFLRDMFGKCEICFRAGHCNISQCKEQEINELDIINRVVNAAHFTAKLNPELKSTSPYYDDPNVIPTLMRINNKINKVLKKDLNNAVTIGSTKYLAPKLQNLIDNFATTNAVPAKARVTGILSDQKLKNNTSASVTFWDDKSNIAAAAIADSKKAFADVKKNKNEIDKLKKLTKKNDKKNVKKALKKEIKSLNRLDNKIKKLNKKSVKNEKLLKRLAKSPELKDGKTKSAINNSLAQLKDITSSLKNMQIFK